MKADSSLIEARLKQMNERILGIANINDNVIPAGSMFNTLQGLRRDTGVPIVEFNLGLHESPFVCEKYGKSYRRFIIEVLNEELYGKAFEHFIDVCASHFRM